MKQARVPPVHCLLCACIVSHSFSSVHISNDAKQNSTDHESNKDKLKEEGKTLHTLNTGL